ncbi:MAG TPA: hypothetical protein VI956_00010 [Nitrospirota bacterium]|nr:hypothetical protein [Nitrospirota bacterium]
MPVFTLSRKTKTTIIASVVLVLAGLAVLVRYVKPLVPTSTVRVIYGEGEDFKADAAAYKRLFRRNIVFLHFPGARSAPQWWGIDFNNKSLYPLSHPRRLFSLYYVVTGKPLAMDIDSARPAGEWSRQFTESGASFSGNAFSCIVTKTP